MGPFVTARVVEALGMAVGALLTAYWWVLVIRIVASWLNADPRNPIVGFLYAVTEPLLYALRRRFPFLVINRLDLTPLVVLIGISALQYVLVGSLVELAHRIRYAGQ
jgi:YggT family protein